MKYNHFISDENMLAGKHESRANIFNMIALLLLALLAVLTLVLNALGVFTIDNRIMVPIILTSMAFFLAPVLLVLVHDVILKKEKTFYSQKFFKFIIIAFSYLGIVLVGVVLSYHAVMLLVIPPLMLAQYPYERRMFISVLIVTIVIVPLVSYMSFFLGIPDRNLIKDSMTEEQWTHIANRFQVGTERLFSIFFHHFLPRMFCIVAVDFLIFGISVRNKYMLDKTNELSRMVQDEMQQRNEMQSRVIEDLASVIETRDSETGDHVIRTKYYVSIIAKELQKNPKYHDILTDAVIGDIIDAAPLHDVGKIYISDTILMKPGKLDASEFDKMKEHAPKGGEMVKTIFSNLNNSEFTRYAYDIARSHHEKWNGKGYPDGLSGEQIPLAARIMAIADVYDALVSKRVYKEPMSHEEAFQIIVSEAGAHFDPDIVEAVKNIEDLFKK